MKFDAYGKSSSGDSLIHNKIYMAKDIKTDQDFLPYKAVRNGRLFSMWKTPQGIKAYTLPAFLEFLKV